MWRYFNIILCFSILVLLKSCKCGKTSGNRWCNSNINFKDCKDHDTFTRSRKVWNVIHGVYDPGNCNWAKVTFDWQIKNQDNKIKEFKNYFHNETFFIPPHTLDTNWSSIAVYVNECTATQCFLTLYETCVIFIYLDIIEINLNDAYETTVHWTKENYSITVDARKSIDWNFPYTEIPEELFTWTCAASSWPAQYHCRVNISDDQGKRWLTTYYLNKENFYQVNLRIQNIYFAVGWGSLLIYPRYKTPYLRIRSDREPLNYDKDITLSLYCQYDCEYYAHETKWVATIGSEKFEEENKTLVVIKNEIFKDLRETIMDVFVTRGGGYVKRKLRIFRPFNFSDCELKPESGEYGKTEFRIVCDANENWGVWGITLLLWEREIPVISAPQLDWLSFVVPEEMPNVKLWRYDPQLNQLYELILPMGELTEGEVPLGEPVTSVSKALFKLLQLKKMKDEDEFFPIQPTIEKMFEALLKVENEWAGVANVIIKAYYLFYQNSSDPEMVALMLKHSQICLKYMAEEALAEKVFRKNFIPNMGLLCECASIGLVENYTALLSKGSFIEEYKDPVLEDREIEENYEIYNDFFELHYTKELKRFQSITVEFMKMCEEQMMVFGRTPDLDGNIAGGNDVYVGCLRNTNWIRHSRVSVEFIPNPKIDFWFYITKKNPYWWSNLKEGIRLFIVSDVIHYNFYDNEENKTSYQIPDMNFTFKLPELSSETCLVTHTGRFTNISDDVKIFRIDAYKDRDYFIQTNFTQKLKVVVTRGRKSRNPAAESEAKEIQNTVLFMKHIPKNSWHYLHIIRKPNQVWVNYSIGVFTLECCSWDEIDLVWGVTGKVLDRPGFEPQVKCLVEHASALAVGLTNSYVFPEPNPILLFKFKISARPCHLIFYLTISVFTLYCLAIIRFTFLHKRRNIIMLVGDAPCNYQYGYLIVVTTGNKINAGTTSNVKIRLIGKDHNSLGHVLNYPDPNKKLLQKNQEDWFVISCKYPLGDLTAVDIWFDGIGERPSWYCKSIEVMNLQNHEYWYFPFNRWLNLMKTKQIVRQCPEKQMKKSCQKRSFWNIGRGEGKMKLDIKLTIFLSEILSSALFCMAFLFLADYVNVILIQVLAVIFSPLLVLTIHKPLIYWCDLRNHTNLIAWILLAMLVVLELTFMIIGGYHTVIELCTNWVILSGIIIVLYYTLFEKIYQSIVNKFYKVKQYGYRRIFSIRKRLIYFYTFIEKQKCSLYQQFGRFGLRPFLKKHYSSLTDEEITKRTIAQENKKRQLNFFSDVIIYIIYIILLYVVIFASKDSMAVYNNKELKDLMRGLHSRTLAPEDINNINETYQYISKSFIHILQSRKWYKGYSSVNDGMMIDKANKYIGLARLRQHRFGMRCKIHKAVSQIRNLACYPEYRRGQKPMDSGEAWTTAPSEHRLADIWRFRSARETGADEVEGYIATYSGSGYVAPLGRKMLNSFINFEYFLNYSWIDYNIRFFTVEFLTYNAFTNMFNGVRVFWENGASGLLVCDVQVNTVRMVFVEDEFSNMVLAVIISFIVWILILLVKNMIILTKSPRKYLSDIWYIIDLFIIAMSCTYILIFALRIRDLRNFLLQITYARHNQFNNYFHLLTRENNLHILAAILICFSTIRLWKLMRFFKFFRLIERTLIVSIPYFITILLVHNIMLIGYSCIGAVLFGSQSYHFMTIWRAFVSLHLITTGLGKRFDISLVCNCVDHLYFASFVVFTFFMFNMYICILIVSFKEAREKPDISYSPLDYIKEQYKYLKMKLKRNPQKKAKERLKGGEDSKGHVIPKPEHLQGGRVISTTEDRLLAMSWVAKCVLRNSKNNEELDFDLMKNTIYHMFKQDSNKPYVGYIWKKRIITEDRLQKMIFIINNVLAEDKCDKIEEMKQKYFEAREYIESTEKKMERIHQALISFKDCLNGINIDEP